MMLHLDLGPFLLNHNHLSHRPIVTWLNPRGRMVCWWERSGNNRQTSSSSRKWKWSASLAAKVQFDILCSPLSATADVFKLPYSTFCVSFRPVIAQSNPAQGRALIQPGLVWQSDMPAFGQPVAEPTSACATAWSPGGILFFLQDISFRGLCWVWLSVVAMVQWQVWMI